MKKRIMYVCGFNTQLLKSQLLTEKSQYKSKLKQLERGLQDLQKQYKSVMDTNIEES